MRSQLKDRQENGDYIIAQNDFGFTTKFIGQPFPKGEMRQHVLSNMGLLLKGAEELISISISPRQGYEQDIYYRLTIQYYKGAFQTLKCTKTFSIVEFPEHNH